MNWHVYIIQSVTGRLYTGITNDPPRRLLEHNGVKPKGAKATRSGRPWTFVFLEPQLTKIQALQREYQIKSLRRREKLIFLQAHGEIESRLLLKDQRVLRDLPSRVVVAS